MKPAAYAGKTVLVTGASTGIGAACALYLDGLGFRVVGAVRREEDAAALRARASSRFETIFLDVTCPEQIGEAVATLAGKTGAAGLYGLVNNAGIAVLGPLEFVPMDLIRKQFEVNVLGLVAVTQAFLPMLRTARGRIVNIGSITGRIASPFMGPYAASKFAVEALNDALRMEAHPWGIDVALIEPGAVHTAIWEKSEREGAALRRSLPEACARLYGSSLDLLEVRAKDMQRIAVPAARVARKVAHALTARRPRARYVVGWGVRTQILLGACLPARMLDGVQRRLLGIR